MHIDETESSQDAKHFGGIMRDAVSLHFRTGDQGGDPDVAADDAGGATMLSLTLDEAEDEAPLSFSSKNEIAVKVIKAVRDVEQKHTTRLRWSDSLDCSTCDRGDACPKLAEEMMQAAFAAVPDAPKRYVVAAVLGAQAACRVARRDRDRRLSEAEERELRHRDGEPSALA